MNENHSRNGLDYRPRWLAPHLRAAAEAFPVVVLTGARQVGKSTLLRREFSRFAYRTLDDLDTLEQAKTDPASLWRGASRVVIDEAQRAPELFPAVKMAVDASNRALRFVLSGSSNLLLMQRIGESLAGRAAYFELLPLTWGEAQGCRDPRRFEALWDPSFEVDDHRAPGPEPLPHLLRGFMPALLRLVDGRQVLQWWEGYVKTYLERDLRELTQIESLVDFRRLLIALALRTGNVVNQSALGRDTGISQPTVNRYLKLLEVTHTVERVAPFLSDRFRRVVKSPKAFFLDPGLATFLAGYHDEQGLGAARERGGFFETLVYLHLKAASELSVPKTRVLYWRTSTGTEVDFVLERGRKALAVEAKFTRNPGPRDASGLLRLMEGCPEVVRGVVLHAGERVRWLHSQVVALPWWWPWLDGP